MSTLIAKLCAGMAFGAALTASGVFSPWVIISQMRLENFHMLQAFLTASAFSAILMIIARNTGISKCTPRSPSTLGYFSYGISQTAIQSCLCVGTRLTGDLPDGNILGGIVLGIGMTLTGACPGTVLVQLAFGIRSGYFAMIGGILGGGLYNQLAPHLRSRVIQKHGIEEKNLTIYQRFNIAESRVVLAFEMLCIGVVSTAAYSTTRATSTYLLYSPIVGGLWIGAGQATSLVLTGNAVGVSAAYDELVQFTQWACRIVLGLRVPKGVREPLPRLGSISFATGIITGTLILVRFVQTPIPGGQLPIPASRAILGGVAMVFGARLAGGCTSGHGISGMSTMSISSIVTVASIFVGGMGLAAVLI